MALIRRLCVSGLLPLLLALPPAAAETAPPAATISLREAVLTTLRQNAALRVAQEEIAIREGLSQQAAGAFDWSVRAGFTQERIRTPLAPGQVAGTDRTSYAVGATRVLRSGIVIDPLASVVSSEGADTGGPAQGASDLSLRIIAPLLRGRGAESTGAAEAAARGDIAVATLLYRHALAAQVFDTAAAYWSARAAAESLAVQHDVERRARELLEALRELVENRVFPSVYQIQAEANLREKTTVRRAAELREISARLALARALGLAPEQMVSAPPAGDGLPAAGGDHTTLAEPAMGHAAVLRALGGRADYLAVRESVVPLTLLTRQAEIDRRPRLDLAVTAGYRGRAAGSDAFRPLHEQLTGGNASVGLSLDWPVHNHAQLGLLRERRAAVQQAEAQAAALATDISAEVLTALAEVRIRAEIVAAATDATTTARRALESQQVQLRNGDSSVLDVINLENLSSSARLSLIDAQAGYAIAVARLRYSMGAIFTAESAESGFGLEDLTRPPLP